MRKLTFWLTLLLIFTIPWEDSITVAFGTGSSLTRMFGLGVAGLWLLTVIMEGRFNRPHLFHALAIFFILWNILSYWWTVDTTWSYLMLIIWEMLQKPDELMAGLQALILGGFVLIGSTLINYLRGTAAVNYEVRFSATGVNAVDLAVFLLVGLPIAWHLFKHPIRNNWILKYINLAYLPLAVFTVLLTASRTSLFAIVPAAIFIGWPKRLDAGRILLAMIILLLSFIIFKTILPAAVVDRLASAGTSIQKGDLSGRVTLWRDTIAVFEQHPFFGSGTGSMTFLIGSFSHQTFLSVLAETGLIGFFLFILVVGYVFSQIFKLPKGYLGLWLSTFFVWFIGVLSVTFEFRKITWVIFTFIIIQGESLRRQWRSKKDDIRISEAEEISSPDNGLDSQRLSAFQEEQNSI